MDVIQSYFVNTKTYNNTRTITELVSAQAMLSCKFLKKYGYSTILYTSNDLLKYFQSHPYDDIITIDLAEYEYITKNNFWSGTKLICCEKHPNPYVHVDIDLFLIEDVLSDHINNDIIFLHEEPWMMSDLKLDNALCAEKFNVQLVNSYNAAILGGSNYALLKSNLNLILHYAKNQYSDVNNIIKENLKLSQYKHWLFCVFLEQILLPNNMLKNVPNISTIIDTSKCKNNTEVFSILKKNNVVHLWYLKNFIHYIIGIDNLIKYMTKYYFDS